jgi:hypothetical protein
VLARERNKRKTGETKNKLQITNKANMLVKERTPPGHAKLLHSFHQFCNCSSTVFKLNQKLAICKKKRKKKLTSANY